MLKLKKIMQCFNSEYLISSWPCLRLTDSQIITELCCWHHWWTAASKQAV